MEKYIKAGIAGLLTLGVGMCIGQKIGFAKADKTLVKIYNTEHGGIREIDGVEYLINVAKRVDK